MQLHNQWAVRVLAMAVMFLAIGSLVFAGPFSKPKDAPVVVRAAVDPVEPDRLVILGMNFSVTTPPVVMLANAPLQVVAFTDEEIVAKLPLDVPAARYRLQVLVDGESSSLVDITFGQQPASRSES